MPSRRLIVRREAEEDIVDSALWYESQESDLGSEFISEIGVAIQRALNDPRAFSLLRATPEARRVLARRFPYRIFYIVRTNALVVFAVLHGARHDRRWKQRVANE